MTPRRIFIAGSTGATGRTVLPLADRLGLTVVPHARPRPTAERPVDPRAAVVDLADEDALARAMAGCTTVVQLIGTMRTRFARGDTYETSDVGTTRQLAAAAGRAGVDHLVLLSSVGAGRPMGAYLQAKAQAEAIVRESGIAYTILRPSAFVGEGHQPPPGMAALTRVLGLARYQPIALEDLAAAILEVAAQRAPLGAALEGRALWDVVARARATVAAAGARPRA